MASFTPLEDTSKSVKDLGREAGNHLGVIVDKSCRVYITNIPYSRIEAEGANALKKEFEVFGVVDSYQMFTDRSGRFVGSALCTYRSPADATAARTAMHGTTIDGSVISAVVAKDHGVVLFHQNDRSKGFIAGKGSVQEDKWSHDKYEMIKEGKDMSEVVGYQFRSERTRGRGRGRGRGGYRMPKAEYIDTKFEQYIAERDAQLNKPAETKEVQQGGDETNAKSEESTPAPEANTNVDQTDS